MFLLFRYVIMQKEFNQGKVIKYCEKACELWKNADSGLPGIDDERKKLARLKNH